MPGREPRKCCRNRVPVAPNRSGFGQPVEASIGLSGSLHILCIASGLDPGAWTSHREPRRTPFDAPEPGHSRRQLSLTGAAGGIGVLWEGPPRVAPGTRVGRAATFAQRHTITRRWASASSAWFH